MRYIHVSHPFEGLALKNAPGVFVVILNKRGVTQSGAFSASTRRAEK